MGVPRGRLSPLPAPFRRVPPRTAVPAVARARARPPARLRCPRRTRARTPPTPPALPVGPAPAAPCRPAVVIPAVRPRTRTGMPPPVRHRPRGTLGASAAGDVPGAVGRPGAPRAPRAPGLPPRGAARPGASALSGRPRHTGPAAVPGRPGALRPAQQGAAHDRHGGQPGRRPQRTRRGRTAHQQDDGHQCAAERAPAHHIGHGVARAGEARRGVGVRPAGGARGDGRGTGGARGDRHGVLNAVAGCRSLPRVSPDGAAAATLVLNRPPQQAG